MPLVHILSILFSYFSFAELGDSILMIFCSIYPACALAIFVENDHTKNLRWCSCHGRLCNMFICNVGCNFTSLSLLSSDKLSVCWIMILHPVMNILSW